jgi:hypothetical protein
MPRDLIFERPAHGILCTALPDLAYLALYGICNSVPITYTISSVHKAWNEYGIQWVVPLMLAYGILTGILGIPSPSGTLSTQNKLVYPRDDGLTWEHTRAMVQLRYFGGVNDPSLEHLLMAQSAVNVE